MATLKVGIDARKAKQGADEFGRATDRMKTKAGSATKAIKSSFASTLKSAFLLGGGIYGITRAFTSLTNAAMIQEDAEMALAAAIGVSNNARDATLGQLERHAAALQKLTIFGDEEILSQMAYAKNLGVTTELLDEAATAAIGLAAKYRLDLKTAMMLIGRASMGQTQMLTRYGITLDDSLSTQEKFNKLLIIGAASFHLAEAAAETTAGKLKTFNNVVGDLKEDLGEGLLPVLVSVAEAMTGIINDPDWRSFFKTQSEGWKEVFGGFQNLEMVLRGVVEQKKKAAELMGGGGSAGAGAGIGLTGAVEPQWLGSAGYSPRSTPTPWVLPDVITAEEITRKQAQLDEMESQRQKVFETERQGFFDAQGQQRSLDAHNERLKRFKETTEAAKDAEDERLQIAKDAEDERLQIASARVIAMAHMYDTIGSYDDAAHKARLSLLQQELDEFRAIKIAETDIVRYELERQRQLQLEAAQKGDDIAKGFGTMFEELERDRLTLGEVGGGTATSIHSEWVGAFQGMATEGASWSESMEGFFINVGKSFSNMMAQMAAEALMFDAISPLFKAAMAGIGGALAGGGGSTSTGTGTRRFTGLHSGGTAGSGGMSRSVDPSVFAFAPRLHGGLRPNEFPAILEQGERVTPKGGSGEGGVEVRLRNEGSPVEITSAQSYMVGDQRIIDVSMKAASGNRPYQNAHGI